MQILRLLLILLVGVSFSAASIAQNRTCGTDALMEQLLQDPEYFEAHQQKLVRAAQMAENQIDFREECTSTIVLPIAIHFQNVSNPDRACLEALAANQIATVNADFQGTNSDIVTWDENQGQFFPGISNGDGCIEFCIPTMNHPPGFGISDGDPAVTINQFSSDFSSAWSGYINVFVRNIGALGYSPLGGDGNGDGVTVDLQAFGTTPSCGQVSPGTPYHLGRTLTHELGHYFLLYHIWRNNGCGLDDQVNDTPLADDEYFGCPNIGVSSCGSNDMHMNYMDYTNDACMYMFSAGQVTRMENYILANLTNVINNAANVCAVEEPTCNDGIQNGDEEGVDCGGSNCPPCGTCDDGVQNGDETGVDCGGSICPPCQSGCTHNLTLTINFDFAPSQVTWSVTDQSGTVLDSGGPYTQNAPGSSVVENICLPDGCFTFTIFDSGGNGLCCRAGEGSYTLVGPNGEIASGGQYGFSQSTNFCLEGGGGPTCTDGVQNGDEEGIDCGGTFCPPCETEPTCNDGIQNGDEEGIDCGGTFCPPCVSCNDGVQNGDEEGVDCGGTFCPPCEGGSCGAPDGDFVIFFSNPGLVQLNWNVVSGANLYEVRYRILGTSNWSVRTTTGTSALLNRLEHSTTYEYQIRALCPSGWSDPAVGTFTTNSPREQDLMDVSGWSFLNLYPNPASESLSIELFLEAEAHIKLSLIDILGRQIQSSEYLIGQGINSISIDVSGLTDGFHLLKIERENEVIVKSFIKD